MLKESHDIYAVITDTSCFILLDKIDAFEVLHKIYSHVVTTPQIAKEFGKVLPDWIQIIPVKNVEQMADYAEKVDIGEASAITLALELKPSLVILDDLKGRNLASKLNLKYTGTLGVLIAAKQNGVIAELKVYFDKIKTTDFRIAPELLDNILKASGEI